MGVKSSTATRRGAFEIVGQKLRHAYTRNQNITGQPEKSKNATENFRSQRDARARRCDRPVSAPNEF